MRPLPSFFRAAFLVGAIVSSSLLIRGDARGATFIVDSTADGTDDTPGDGVCFNSIAGGCTLRAAIEEANELAGPDRIHFDIGTGSGVKTIRPTFITIVSSSEGPIGLGFPNIREELTIDGWTQGGPGYKGPPRIEIDGTLVHLADAGFFVSSESMIIRGLIVNNFSDHAAILLAKRGGGRIEGCYIGTDSTGEVALPNGIGIQVESPDNTIGGDQEERRNIISANGTGVLIVGASAARTSVLGNYIGTNVAGDAALGNDAAGVEIREGASRSVIGSDSASGRNVISGNGVGVFLVESHDNSIFGNYVGTDSSGHGDLGNITMGVAVLHGSDNRIGTIRDGEGNTIAFNAIGVLVQSPLVGSKGDSIRGNSIFENDALGIDLAAGDVTPNDPLDADSGPNGLQNFPELVGAVNFASTTSIEGELHSLPASRFAIDFYSSPRCDASGNGEGKVYLRSVAVVTDTDGDAEFKVDLGTVEPSGRFITATAVNVDTLDTSEFSRCVEVTDPFVVTNVDDSGPGSLRQAILDANSTPGSSRIEFLIPDASPIQVIRAESPLPDVVEPVSILGSTQPGFDGSPIVFLDGTHAGADADGLRITAGHSLVEGLGIGRYTRDGIRIEDGGDNVIQGCVLGTDDAGALDLGNAGSGVAIIGSADNVIGGTEPGNGNMIAHNAAGVRVTGAGSTGNRIRGNSLFSNATIGIDLGVAGRNANDSNDADTGANGLQNQPVLTGAALSGGEVSIAGTLNSGTDTDYELDFYASLPTDGGGAGRIHLGSQSVTTAGNDVAFEVTLALDDPSATRITATATRRSAPFDTSELSPPRDLTERGGRQVPGDCNQDGQLDISDTICLVGFLFLGSPTQLPCGDGSRADPANIALTDWQPDSRTDISDAIGLVTFLFNGGAAHPLAVTGDETHGCVPIFGCPDNASCPE